MATSSQTTADGAGGDLDLNFPPSEESSVLTDGGDKETDDFLEDGFFLGPVLLPVVFFPGLVLRRSNRPSSVSRLVPSFPA